MDEISGTGHSSLAMSCTLPLNVLKLDRSFVQQLPDSETDAAVAGAVVSLARQLRLAVVAEGVETPGQQQFLADLGWSYAAGLPVRPPPARPPNSRPGSGNGNSRSDPLRRTGCLPADLLLCANYPGCFW